MCSVLSMRGAIFFVSSVCVPCDDHKHLGSKTQHSLLLQMEKKNQYVHIWNMQKMVQCHITEAH